MKKLQSNALDATTRLQRVRSSRFMLGGYVAIVMMRFNG
jgi:hypothetical protein